MGLCLSTSYIDEPVRPPVQMYVIQQQQQKQQPYVTPSAPPMTPPPSAAPYVPYSQYTYAVPYTPAPSAKKSFSNEDPMPLQYNQGPPQQMYPPAQMYPPVQTYYVQQPVYRQPVQQTNTATAAVGGFLVGSILADMMDD